jgi:hypothetical protein
VKEEEARKKYGEGTVSGGRNMCWKMRPGRKVVKV